MGIHCNLYNSAVTVVRQPSTIEIELVTPDLAPQIETVLSTHKSGPFASMQLALSLVD